MKRITAICLAALLFACQNEKKPETKVAAATATDTPEEKVDPAEMQKKWEAYMTPGQPHAMMAQWNGTWEGQVTVWMDPSAPPEKSTSVTTNKMIMGGRYQLSEHKGNMMGQPFEGQSTVAYDNVKKVYISTWIDNMGTGIMVLEGPWNDATKTMELKGKMVDCMTGKEVEVKETFRVVDENTHVMEMFDLREKGKETKTMEIIFKRKAKA